MAWKKIVAEKADKFFAIHSKRPNVVINPSVTEQEFINEHKHIYNLFEPAEATIQMQRVIKSFHDGDYTIYGMRAIKLPEHGNDTVGYQNFDGSVNT